MGNKIKAWFCGSLVSICLCTSTEALVAEYDQPSSISKSHSGSSAAQSNFIPFTNEQAQTLIVEPQLFLDGIGPQCGGTVWTLEVNGDKKTLRCSNQYAIHGDDKIRRKLSTLFSKKRPISEEEAYTLAQTGELSNPSGAVLFVVDRAKHSANLLSGGPENLRDVFKTQESFGCWLQESTQYDHSSDDVSLQPQRGDTEGSSSLVANTLDAINSVVYAPNKVTAIANGLSGTARVLKSAAATPALSHLSKLSGALEFAGTHLNTIAGAAGKILSPISTLLTIGQAIGLDEAIARVPDLLYPARKSELAKFVTIHGKIVMALLGAPVNEQDVESYLVGLGRMSDCIYFYNVQQGLLSQEYRQKLKRHPQKAVEQLVLESGQNICCLVVGSGWLIRPNFFEKLYVCRLDPVSDQPISEVIKARGLEDGRVMDSLSAKCPLDEFVQGKTCLFVIDRKANQIYLVSYEPQGIPQFPNIFTPENWNHWKKVFSSLGERLKGTGELLGVSFGKKLRALPVVGNYAADKLGLKHELRSVEGISNTLLSFEKKKVVFGDQQLMIGYEEGENQPATYDSNAKGTGDLSDDELWGSTQDENTCQLKVPGADKRRGENWNEQASHSKEAELYNNHPYDGDEYIESLEDSLSNYNHTRFSR